MNDTQKLDVQHGILAAYYLNGPDGYRPVLECICGEIYREFNWEEAGTEFDIHLLSTSGQSKSKTL
jgi:hypothetical protein